MIVIAHRASPVYGAIAEAGERTKVSGRGEQGLSHSWWIHQEMGGSPLEFASLLIVGSPVAAYDAGNGHTQSVRPLAGDIDE
jgi:hypothetical protein